jgi:CRISPR-associated protein Cmr4
MTSGQDNSNQVLPYQVKPFFYCALDPIHVGAGGYRLGRVDMTIVREPGTNLPKIPGTALSGAARSYAALLYGKPEAAGGYGGKSIPGEKKKCPIIATFGTASESGGGQAGTVSIGDAQIVFFPVKSLGGCVMVTCAQALAIGGLRDCSISLTAEETAYSSIDADAPGLNLGWIWFEKARVKPWTGCENLGKFGERLALVHDSLFSHIVNSNLEVRTSVVIDPETGAAQSGLLFSYEAIPRQTWLYNEVVFDDYRRYEPDAAWTTVTHRFDRSRLDSESQLDSPESRLPRDWASPLDVVTSGLELMEHLGVGGMGTRGFGRLKSFQKAEVLS